MPWLMGAICREMGALYPRKSVSRDFSRQSVARGVRFTPKNGARDTSRDNLSREGHSKRSPGPPVQIGPLAVSGQESGHHVRIRYPKTASQQYLDRNPSARRGWTAGNLVAFDLRSAYNPTNTRAAPLVRKDDAHQGRVFLCSDNSRGDALRNLGVCLVSLAASVWGANLLARGHVEANESRCDESGNG